VAGDVRALGFTREVDAWMEAADVLVGKAGGLTCSEALIKGVPMVFFRPTPGQEVRNADFLAASGAAVHADTLEDAEVAVRMWLTDEDARARARERALRIAKPHAAEAIARAVLAAARSHAAARG
jgi:processive 1,2-diacylglycerol beta-glucosyltransferase